MKPYEKLLLENKAWAQEKVEDDGIRIGITLIAFHQDSLEDASC